eukprot:97897-Prymnesium_polylepis.1
MRAARARPSSPAPPHHAAPARSAPHRRRPEQHAREAAAAPPTAQHLALPHCMFVQSRAPRSRNCPRALRA